MNNVIPFPVKTPMPETLWQAQAQIIFKNDQYEMTLPWQFMISPNSNKTTPHR